MPGSRISTNNTRLKQRAAKENKLARFPPSEISVHAQDKSLEGCEQFASAVKIPWHRHCSRGS